MLYAIVSATKHKWSGFYGGNIINNDIVVLPTNKIILPTIHAHLKEIWCNEWSQLKGHQQTKFWFTKPEPLLASKFLNMSRENLSVHGWWKKHLTIANLSGNPE